MATAIIGGGISGLGAAYALRHDPDLVVFEAAQRAGGHANTATVQGPDGTDIAVDTGFIVFNDRNYPNLVGLFQALGVATQPSDMSFAASLRGGQVEYNGHSVFGLFAQPQNLVRPRFLAMVRDVPRFFRLGRALLAQPVEPSLTMAAFLERHRFSRAFVEDHLIPMAAAIWSAPPDEAMAFPAHSLCQFFANHGLLSLTDRPEWRTVTGGSQSYVQKIAAILGPRLRVGSPVTRVERRSGGVWVTARGQTERFDRVIFACHLDAAFSLLADADGLEASILTSFRTQANTAWLHSDTSLMPKRRRVWSAWNYLDQGAGPVAVSYWMNQLQSLDERLPLFVTLNPRQPPKPALTHGRFQYRHPQFDSACLIAQQRIHEIQGYRGCWWAGAQLGYGFHEDGLASGLRVALPLGGAVPWQSPEQASAHPLATAA
ncbi:MAG: NAD/FAD-binding protein [Alphaproteobacteria bacterium]|nr:FAD-dependent oxidoreductase [Alphaproteobacteria bacterium]TAD89348.1 MAG: NAD/FAD-binding protein [Alphaproteobacteria bacterium]